MISECETKIKHSEYQSPDDSFILHTKHTTAQFNRIRQSIISPLSAVYCLISVFIMHYRYDLRRKCY